MRGFPITIKSLMEETLGLQVGMRIVVNVVILQ